MSDFNMGKRVGLLHDWYYDYISYKQIQDLSFNEWVDSLTNSALLYHLCMFDGER